MAQGFSLADQLVNAQTVAKLASGFEGVFDTADFEADVLAQIQGAALKERLNLIASALAVRLSPDPQVAADQIMSALPPPLDPTLTDDDFGHFIYAPLGIYAENHMVTGHFACGLRLLEEITKRFSMEFSIRAFLNHDQALAMNKVADWARSDNYHVRRLASEGTRPRLPWGQNVGLSVDDTLPILDVLHADPTRYVTRSVANHLNDVSKIEPDRVIAQLDAWVSQGRQSQPELLWMRKHALRSLIKAGYAPAMQHLGYRPDVGLENCAISVPLVVERGQKIAIDVAFTLVEDAPLIVDYIVDFQKAKGRTSSKVFKLKTFDAKAGDAVRLTKQHHFKDTATTFALFAGDHRVHLQVNGRIVAECDFELT